MKEILFRGFHKFEGNTLYPPNKKWVYGYYIFQNGQHWIKDISDMSMTYTVEPESVGQFTGLKDKNGKDIYDGDIVDCSRYFEPPEIYRVLVKDIRFLPIEMFGSNLNYLEIVGNIYENPELVKVEK